MENVVKVSADPNLYDDDPVAKAAFENFGIKYLFPWQRLVIANILEAYDCFLKLKDMSIEERLLFDKENTDSFCKGRQIVLLPTGAGKSLCFQVPALIFDGPTLVIYPLLALMSDQQRRMEDGSLRSVVFRGGQSEEERTENFEKIKNGAQIILANPEVLQSEKLIYQLKNVGIKHIAIDEAHCVSEWGDTFRSAYLGLGKVIEQINPPVITAFTATASPSVLERVSQILFNGIAHVVRSESDRKNIRYYVIKAGAKDKEALLLAKKEQKPLIFFCGTRDKAEAMCKKLNMVFGDNTSRFYHAGLEKEQKEVVEKWFYESKDGILCATCAYGMGVDKKDIKTVIHLEPPETPEAYIQEAGRGGRDGSVAKAILLWSLNDSLTFGLYGEKSRQAYIKHFAETTECRRQVLLDALGGEQAYCSGCDVCENREKERDAKNLKGLKKRLYYIKEKKDLYVSDLDMAYSLVKRCKNYFSEEELEEEVSEKMKNRFLKDIGKNVWNNSDSVDIVRQLKQGGKIAECNILWKGKLKPIYP